MCGRSGRWGVAWKRRALPRLVGRRKHLAVAVGAVQQNQTGVRGERNGDGGAVCDAVHARRKLVSAPVAHLGEEG
jgi:hypothetical protein